MIIRRKDLVNSVKKSYGFVFSLRLCVFAREFLYSSQIKEELPSDNAPQLLFSKPLFGKNPF